MRTHRIGAEGSVARFLDDHTHDPNAEPFPNPWCLFVTGPEGIKLLASKPKRLGFPQRIRTLAGAVLVDVRSYGCKVKEE